MDPLEFSELLLAFRDVCTGIRLVERAAWDPEKQHRWTTLYNALVSPHVTTQDELFTDSLSDLLHKIMIMACSSFAVRDVARSCPGWPFVIMEIDAQIAKKKAASESAPAQQLRTMRDSLERV